MKNVSSLHDLSAGESQNVDVTGGMQGKLGELRWYFDPDSQQWVSSPSFP